MPAMEIMNDLGERWVRRLETARDEKEKRIFM